VICPSLEDVWVVAVGLGPDLSPGPLPSSAPPRWLCTGTAAARIGETTGATIGETGETTAGTAAEPLSGAKRCAGPPTLACRPERISVEVANREL